MWISRTFTLNLDEVISIEATQIKIILDIVCNRIIDNADVEVDYLLNNLDYKIPIEKVDLLHTMVNIHPVPKEMNQQLLL